MIKKIYETQGLVFIESGFWYLFYIEHNIKFLFAGWTILNFKSNQQDVDIQLDVLSVSTDATEQPESIDGRANTAFSPSTLSVPEKVHFFECISKEEDEMPRYPIQACFIRLHCALTCSIQWLFLISLQLLLTGFYRQLQS